MTTLNEEQRILPPECGFNFRDFGGYRTADDRRVKTGMLYRSGLMAFVGDSGRDRLAALGIAAICDLRSSGERERRPTRWHDGLDVEFWARDYDHTFAELNNAVETGTGDAAQMRELMIELYREIAYDHVESYRALFDMLARGKVPVLVNCSAGKDRTGTAVALVLSALGVDRETIMADYALTARADFAFLLSQIAVELGRETLSEQSRVPLFASDSSYLNTLFDTIDARDGSVEGYLENQLGLGADERDRIRHLLIDD